MKTIKKKKNKNPGIQSLLIALTVIAIIAVAAANWLSSGIKTQKLPLLGEPEYKKVTTAQGTKTDTLYPVIPPFSFTDQHKELVTNQTYIGHVYVADFFFTSCPTICPVMSRNLKKVYDEFTEANDVMFLSHTIDPGNDTPEVLNLYAEKLGADSKRWHFVTGIKEKIYQLAENGYYAHVKKDDSEEGGFVHSGLFTLIDRKGHMRGVYDGTSDEEVTKLIKDLNILLSEKNHSSIVSAKTKLK